MGYMGLSKSEIFAAPEVAQSMSDVRNLSYQIESGKDKTSSKYEKSGLSAEKAKEHLNKLVKLMETDKPYCDSNLTLTQLADLLVISTHNLSEILLCLNLTLSNSSLE